MNVALAIIGGFALLAVALALLARRGRDMSLEQWTVGGRGFGTRYAMPRRLLSQSDFFVSAYSLRALGVVVSVVAALVTQLSRR
jgi:hypothetical protein